MTYILTSVFVCFYLGVVWFVVRTNWVSKVRHALLKEHSVTQFDTIPSWDQMTWRYFYNWSKRIEDWQVRDYVCLACGESCKHVNRLLGDSMTTKIDLCDACYEPWKKAQEKVTAAYENV